MSYTVHSKEDRKKILAELGINSERNLFSSIPGSIREPGLDLPEPLSEKELREKLIEISKLNKSLDGFISFLGGGAYYHYIPAVVSEITSISQFYTVYTPYQAEISQGTLQYIFEFQSLICRLTGMDIANASMYDGATALAEAVLLAARVNSTKKVILSGTIHPEYRETVKTYLSGKDMEVVEIGFKEGITDLNYLTEIIDEKTCAVAIQNPNFFGCFEEVFKIRKILRSYPNCLYIIVANPLSLALLKSPSEYGADIVIGDAQSFGNPLSYGGPYLGYFAAKKDYLRHIPGRIVSKTIDSDGKDAYVLSFQVREQHIRKTKATSNICSNHSLNALAATVYLSLLGEEGLKKLANLCLQRAHYFSQKIQSLSRFKLKFKNKFFNEMVLYSSLDINEVLERLYREKILGGISLDKYYPELTDSILTSFTEMNRVSDIVKYIDILKGI